MKDWHAEAKRLRAEGLTYREIGERLGKPLSTVTSAVYWQREHYRGECIGCGGPTSRPGVPRCWSCWAAAQHERIEPRTQQIVAWWAEGLSLREIGERLGWTRVRVSEEVRRLREKGYSLPYRYTMRAGKRVAG